MCVHLCMCVNAWPDGVLTCSFSDGRFCDTHVKCGQQPKPVSHRSLFRLFYMQSSWRNRYLFIYLIISNLLVLHFNKYSLETAVHKLKCVKSPFSVQRSDVPLVHDTSALTRDTRVSHKAPVQPLINRIPAG